MAVDPGGVSGVAQGLFLPQRTLARTLGRAVGKGVVGAWTVEGSYQEQALAIVSSWERLLFHWTVELSQPSGSAYLVVESFKVRRMDVQLSPVEVRAGIETLLYVRGSYDGCGTGGREQSPSDAMGFATNARLRDWGLYPFGRGRGDHKRDALRHLALKVNRLIG